MYYPCCQYSENHLLNSNVIVVLLSIELLRIGVLIHRN